MTGLTLRLFRPSIRWEFPAIHLLSFLIFLGTLACFEFFWRELLASVGESDVASESRPYAWSLGYLIFAYIHFFVHPLSRLNPDLLVAALVYLLFGLMLKFANERLTIHSAALFGAVLGIAYLAKTAMLFLGFVLLATMLAGQWKHRACLRPAGIAMLASLLVTAPFIIAISLSYHRFTFGDAGQLNLAYSVNNETPMHRHWQGDEATHIKPLHSTRKLLSWPEVYEFGTPIAGTYPVWFDPTYWWEGADERMHPIPELKTFIKYIVKIARLQMSDMSLMTIVTLFALLLSDRICDFWRKLRKLWPILLPAGSAFLVYALVYWEPRYTIGQAAAIWGALILSLSIADKRLKVKVLRAAAVTLTVMVVYSVFHTFIMDYKSERRWAEQVTVAEQLRSMGIEPGDRVALIGDGFWESWARLDRVTIVAEVPQQNMKSGDSAAAFWNSDAESQQTVLNVLKSTGTKAVIASTSSKVLPQGWISVSRTDHSVLFFR